MSGVYLKKEENMGTSYPSMEVMTEEFNDYLTQTGITERLTNVLKLLYEMDEKPADPLEFMRVNMTEVISEREELAKLQKEYNYILGKIAILKQENLELKQKLEYTSAEDLKEEEIVFSPSSDNDVGKAESITQNQFM